MPNAEACLTWIDKYGDRDGDGFQEYQTRSTAGYENMAWKDSGDSVMYPDGTLVHGPKALVVWHHRARTCRVCSEAADAKGHVERLGKPPGPARC